jgi:hypothetical protein
MTSPARISLRLRLSSNRAANDSPPPVAVWTWDMWGEGVERLINL